MIEHGEAERVLSTSEALRSEKEPSVQYYTTQGRRCIPLPALVLASVISVSMSRVNPCLSADISANKCQPPKRTSNPLRVTNKLCK